MPPLPVAAAAAEGARRGPKSGEEMDEERLQNIAYEYLCHLEEAKNWITACVGEDLPPTTELEENLRNGVYLAKLGCFFAPRVVSAKKIFDPDLRKYRESGLHFRHTDNINYFLQAAKYIGLPEIFTPETTDIYDSKNMPRVIFCIHALSLFLYKLGIAPEIQDLYGKATFTDEEISNMRSALDEYQQPMPQFRKIGGILANETLTEEEEEAPKSYNHHPPAAQPRKKNYLSDNVVVNFQSRARGFLARQKLFTMLQHYYDREERVIKSQAIWRGVLARRRFRRLVEEKRRQQPAFKPYYYYRQYEKEIVSIQRIWRTYKSRKDFEVLMKSEEMNLQMVRRYLHLLDVRSEDFDLELQLQSLKAEITKAIRHNQQLEKDVDTMDIKIGLLVKNRITVQDVVAHSKTLSFKSGLQRKETFYHGSTAAHNTVGSFDDDALSCGTLSTVGLKALKKESRKKLDAYQHLFYLLQTNPTYLAKLVFATPQTMTTKFLESVILTLYNFGSNQREEFLLLKLFQTALEEEVRCKVEKLNDIVSGQPMVVKMIVYFYRSGKGLACLREMLGPMISRVLEDKTLRISTSPVEIYKQWVSQMETESGKSSGMPYDVSAQTALEHEEVQKRLQRSITRLKQVATLFLATIVKSKSKLPYGILYMAKVLFNALRNKFPEAPEKDILKVIGNLLYYRYINAAIVAPDSCHIIDVSGSDQQALNNEQRKNLASIAKVLQFVASKKGFGEESAHLVSLNPYIVESHDKMKNWLRDCCVVPDPEEAFAMDQYTEATLIAKPAIYISLTEICDTHQLMLDYRYQIAPDENDRLHELLDDLGGKPSLCSLLGAAENAERSGTSLAHLGETEVCLTLTNKFQVPVVDLLDVDRLFVKTKQLIMTVLPCTRENNIMGCLKSKSSDDQLECYWSLVEKKERAEKVAENNRTFLDHTNLFQDDEGTLHLDDCKRQILKNLQILERHGLVSKKDGFHAIVSSIGKDIVNQKHYRTRRRREIFSLKNTQKSLEKKRLFYQSQLEYYNQYLKQCLASQQAEGAAAKKKVRFHKAFGGLSSLSSVTSSFGSSSNRQRDPHKMKSKQSISYSGAKLFDKGILLTIDGLPTNQFKNVHFDFTPTDEDGIFEVSASFMGVKLEHVEVDIQELLQLQYEGVSVMNMFGKARINVNLLLHCLNVKFYGRK